MRKRKNKFDEVQDCPNVINSMKSFCENAPQYHVACAGSLLGITLAKPSSFPVGKVNLLKINPMTFSEFLIANGDAILAEYLETEDCIEPIPDAFFNPLYEKLKMYYVTGGMPEPDKIWTEARNTAAMQEALADIIAADEMTRDQLNAELKKGVDSIKAGNVYSADEIDAILAKKFSI